MSDFPPIQAAYEDEFGSVDPDVYEAAKQIWTPAERLAIEFLHDSPKGMQLMLKAVVRVSSVRANNPSKIVNLRSYLFRSYKNLLLAELKKANCHLKILDGLQQEEINYKEDEEVELNQKILINELRREMDNWMREVFDLLRLGYGYEEMVPKYGAAANVIRSKFSKRIAWLAREIQEKIKMADKEIHRSS